MTINTGTRSPRSRLALLVGVVLALTLVLGACSSSGSSKSASSSPDITIKDFAFTTKAVKAGATVTVHNNGPSDHTVTSDDGTSFDVSVSAGKDATFTAPAKAGSYKFHCSIHPTLMKATLTVQ
jgi:plastocyanin